MAFLAVYGLLLGFFLPIDFKGNHFFDCLFSVTTTSGGDTGAHHYPAQYLIQELLPNWKLTGWAPGWYAGMPMLSFYFPLPFLIIAIFDVILPYEVAFKLGSVLGIFLLPLTAYGLGRLLRIRKPYPVLAAVFAVAFVFMEKSGSGLYSIYGGNILSSLAGEFSYMLSFALVALFLGTLYRGMEKPRVNMLFVANCILLMILALSHIVTTMILVFIVPGLLLPLIFSGRDGVFRFGASEAGYLVAVAAYTFCMIAYFALPLWVLGVSVVVFVAGLTLGLAVPRLEGRSSTMGRSVVYLLAVGFLGFCLTAFWSIPFGVNMKWTAGMEWSQLDVLSGSVALGTKVALTAVGAVGIVASISAGIYARSREKRVIPFVGTAIAITLAILALIMTPQLSNTLIPRTWQFLTVFILGIVGMAYAVAKRERRALPLAWLTFIAFVMYVSIPDGGPLWNGRLLSFWYFSFFLWAAYALTWLLRGFMTVIWDLLQLRTSHSRRLYVPLLAVVIIIVTGFTSTVAGGWIQWNYLGYEKKAAWPEYEAILDYIDTLPPNSRVMIEHGSVINDFGTPRAFEIIPYWTQADTMEGTLMEASYTAPFHFINQRELSEQPSNAIIGVSYPPSVDTDMGLTHLQLMNIPYFLAFENSESEEKVIPGVEADPRAELLATFGKFKLYHIKDCSGYVEIMQNEPVRVNIGAGTEWRDMAVEWYKNDYALDIPIIMDNGDEVLWQFTEITSESATYPPEVPIETDGEITNVVFENEKLSFDTTAIGVPHWIKISYFPNWHVKGAEGPYLASPSMMMVIPTSEHVELYYGSTWANILGQVLETVAWAVLIGLTIWRLIVWKKRRGEPLPEGPAPGGPVLEAPEAPRGPEAPAAVEAPEAAEGHAEAALVPPPLPEEDDQDIPDLEEDLPLR